jgi:hypothetical protein
MSGLLNRFSQGIKRSSTPDEIFEPFGGHERLSVGRIDFQSSQDDRNAHLGADQDGVTDVNPAACGAASSSYSHGVRLHHDNEQWGSATIADRRPPEELGRRRTERGFWQSRLGGDPALPMAGATSPRGPSRGPSCSTMKVVGRWPRVATISLIGMVLVLTSCGTGPPSVSDPTVTPWQLSRSPQLILHVSAGCPASLAHYDDVVNAFPGPPLVPQAAPFRGLVCWYNDGNKPDRGSLGRQVRLSSREAGVLATAVRKLSLRAPTGTFSCPADSGTVALIGFSYASRHDVALWYSASGCQTLDNGQLGSFEGANPSFGEFEAAMSELAPAMPESSGSL